jgi:hypothetical protein
MNGSSFLRFKSLSIFMLALGAASLAACGEKLDAGNGCPLLCPLESAPLLDTIVDGVVLDTSAVGFPNLGYEANLFLAQRGDTADVRVITRYDSLPIIYQYKGSDSTIVRVDSAYILAPRPRADSAVAFAANGRIEVYDVTDAANDTAAASLAAQMTAANKIGVFNYLQGESPDTLKILLDTARVRSRVVNTRNLRLGLRMVSASSDLIRFVPINAGAGIGLTIVPNSDTSASRIKFNPITYSPDQPEYLRAALSDFQISVAGSALPANTLRVGGAPAQRVLMKFDIPSHIVDSSVVVRATLLLTQRPSRSADAGSSIGLQIVPIVASNEVQELHTQLEFAGSNVLYPTDSLATVPKDSGVVSLEIVKLLRAWKGQDVKKTPRLAALYLSTESSRIASFDFFSIEAPPALRPRVRITYITRVNTGQP